MLFICVVVMSFFRKKSAYSAFVEGAGSAVELVVGVFPYLIAIMAVVEIFRASGASSYLATWLAPVMRAMGIPVELTELMILRPVSGAGSLAILDSVFETYGADSYISRCAAVIYGSSETVFYISAIYFSQSKVRKLRYAIPVALIATVTGCILGCYMCRLF